MSDSPHQPFRLTVEAPDPCRRIIKVEVPRQEYDRQYQQRLTAAVRNHQRPGWRKGKTPRAIVEKELGAHLRAETFEQLVPQAYRAAVIEHSLLPITDPTLENLVAEEGRDLGFDLVVEVRPEVTAANYEGLPIKEQAIEISSEEIDEVLERLRQSRAIFETVPRAAAAGDEVTLDIVPCGSDGAADESRRAAGQRLIIGDAQNLPAFNEALLGVAAGQTRDVSVAYPEDYPNAELRSRTVVFKLHVADVRQKLLPEIDDAFASQLAEGQTLLELRGRIRQGLQAEAERRRAEEMDAQALDQLLQRNEVPVPPSLVEAWLKTGLEDLHKRNQQLGRTSTDAMDENFRETFRPVAEREIKGLFLLEAVRRQEGIDVTDEQVEARIVAIAAEHGFDLAKYRAFLAQGDERDRIRRGLLERRTYDFLLSRAEITAAVANEEPAADADRNMADESR